MSKINIKLMSEVTYATLRKNIDTYASKFTDNPEDSSWINEITKEKAFDVKKYQIEDFDLLVPNSSYDRETDLKNAKILYEHLNVLPGYILSEPRFWLWVMFEKAYKTALAGMEKRDATAFKHQWLFTDGLRRGLFFGILSRLYYRVELTYAPENTENPYYLTEYVMESPVRFREISWRTISNHKFVVKSMLKAEIRANKDLSFEEKGDYFSKLAKEICKLGSIKLIDAMSEEDIENYIYERYVKIIQDDLYKMNLKKYNDAVALLSAGTEKEVAKAIKLFDEIKPFMDSENMIKNAKELYETLKPKKKKLFGFLGGK